MKYDHKVKYNGVWYAPFEDIPEEPQISDLHSYTKTDINRMPIAELQDLALKMGIADANETNGTELKKIIAEKLNL